VTYPPSGVIHVANLVSYVMEPPSRHHLTGITGPGGIAIAADGHRAHVSVGDNVVSSVVPIDLTIAGSLAPIAIDTPARYLVGLITVSPDGRTVYSTNLESGYGSAQVSILSTASNKLIAQLGGLSAQLAWRWWAVHALYVLNVAPSGDGGITSSSERSPLTCTDWSPSFRLLLVAWEWLNPDQSSRARLTPSAGDKETVRPMSSSTSATAKPPSNLA
jgi:hypothetical protein